MINYKLEAPWHTYQKKLNALFGQDPDIIVGDIFSGGDDEYDYGLDIQVMKHDKFVALDRVLTKWIVFGGIILKIFLYDEENNEKDPTIELYRTIFDGNPICKDVKETVDNVGVSHVYVRFQPEVIQFFDDDLSDYNGNWNGLAEDIADQVFSHRTWQINFCTAAKEEKVDG